MQARAQTLVTERPSQAVEFFQARLNGKSGSAVDRYGMALAYWRLGDYPRAQAALKPALDALPRQPNLAMLNARIVMSQGNPDQAITALAANLEQHPRYAPAILEYADTLITAGKPEEARQVLISHEQALGTRMDTYRLLAFAARDAGHTVEAQYQMANYLFDRGDVGGALAQIDSALRLSSLSSQERSKLKARRTEITDASPDLPRNQKQPPGR